MPSKFIRTQKTEPQPRDEIAMDRNEFAATIAADPNLSEPIEGRQSARPGSTLWWLRRPSSR